MDVAVFKVLPNECGSELRVFIIEPSVLKCKDVYFLLLDVGQNNGHFLLRQTIDVE